MLKDSILIRVVIIILLIISIILPLVASSLTWGSIDADISAGGSLAGRTVNINASLEAEFDYQSVDYVVITDRSGKVEKDENHTVFLEGMGDFQTKVGWVLDSYKDKSYSIRALIYDNVTNQNVYTNITVATHVDFIPWWPVDTPQKASITVTLDTKSHLTQRVVINKVWFEAWTGWVEDENDFSGSKKLWEKSTNHNLNNQGDSKKYNAEVKVDEDYGKIGIVGYADISVIDTNGDEVQKIILPFASTSHPTTVNIYTITQDEYYGIILMVMAYPLTLISICLCAVSIPLVFLRNRFGPWIILVAGIISIIAVYFYINGITTLVDILNEGIKSVDITEGFDLNYDVAAIPIVASVLMFVSFPLAFLNRIPKEKPLGNEQEPRQKSRKKSAKRSQRLKLNNLSLLGY
jgi:hypothetical protein